VAVLAALLTTTPAYAAVVLLAGSLCIGATFAPLPPSARGAGAVVLPVLLLVAAGAVLGAGHRLEPLPGDPVALSAGVAVSRDDARTLEEIAPSSSDTWLAAAIAGGQGDKRAATYLEKALIIDPGNRRAALNLAALYLHQDYGALNEQVAAYYTLLAGYPAPASPPLARH
jgi:hypothetical protein